MTNWKKAFQLTKLELRKSSFNILTAYIVTLIFMVVFIKQMPSYLNEGTVLYDFLFVLLFGFSPLFPKPKSFEVQHLQDGFIASPMVIIQKRLPIPDDIIIKGRIIMHFFYTFPIQLIALIILYLVTPIHSLLSVGSFIAFAVIWLSFSIYVGYVIPRWSIGVSGWWYTNVGLGVMLFILLFIILFALSVIYKFFDNGLVYWTILFAKDFPIISGVISIILAFVGYRIWNGKIRRAMQKINYV